LLLETYSGKESTKIEKFMKKGWINSSQKELFILKQSIIY
jgi:hypothetical protein